MFSLGLRPITGFRLLNMIAEERCSPSIYLLDYLMFIVLHSTNQSLRREQIIMAAASAAIEEDLKYQQQMVTDKNAKIRSNKV
jgi:hypothetical protein